MGGQSKLQLGAFTIFPAFGIILPNGHQTITVDCVAEQQGRFDEVSQLSYGPRREKTCLQGLANNKGADQPAHPRSLISAFVIPLFESNISRLATSEISIF